MTLQLIFLATFTFTSLHSERKYVLFTLYIFPDTQKYILTGHLSNSHTFQENIPTAS